MSRLSLVVATAAVFAAIPAVAFGDAHTVTANGVGQAKVTVTDRRHNAPIVAGVEAAHAAAIPKAIAAARDDAQALAAAAGLTLGALQSVSEAQTLPFYGPGSYELGPFGPNKYCGTERRPVFKTVKGKRRVVRFHKIHRCIVPGDVTVALSVTYAAS